MGCKDGDFKGQVWPGPCSSAVVFDSIPSPLLSGPLSFISIFRVPCVLMLLFTASVRPIRVPRLGRDVQASIILHCDPRASRHAEGCSREMGKV